MLRMRVCCLAMFAVAALGEMSPVPARAEYPEKQITMVVCFPAGGGTDIAARLVNIQLGEALGKPVIIENRGGAGGNIGGDAVANAPKDGYTLLLGTATILAGTWRAVVFTRMVSRIFFTSASSSSTPSRSRTNSTTRTSRGWPGGQSWPITRLSSISSSFSTWR